MAEAVGIAASIIAVVQVADRLASICRFYIEASRDCPKDLAIILLEATSVKTILENIRFLCDVSQSELLANLNGPRGTIKACEACLQNLLALFPEQHQTTASNKRQKLAAALAWPLRKSKADKLLAELGGIKSTLTLAITGNIARDVKDIKADVIAARATLDKQELRDIVDWLKHTNPSSLHNSAYSKHEENTSAWVSQHPHWRSWLDGSSPKRTLWFHGIPGAGKTVLFSHLVEQLISQQEHGTASKNLVIYYYCYYAHACDETIPLLRWIVSQLCLHANSISATMVDRHHQRLEPHRDHLIDEIVSCMRDFNSVTVAIDALDESQRPRTELLSLMNLFATHEKLQNLRVLATSRTELDIEEALRPIALELPMANEYVRHDIERYVSSTLRSSPHFQRWPVRLRDEMQEALADGAKGMFRWAVCQFHILSRLHDEGAIRVALRSLPETLDETYERIFLMIPAQQRPLVREILQLVCVDDDLNAWLDKDVVEMESLRFHAGKSSKVLVRTSRAVLGLATDKISQFPEPDAVLRDLCGCLFHITFEGEVLLAHYTVREYLFSERTRTSTVADFDLRHRRNAVEVGRKMFHHLLHLEAVRDGQDNDLVKFVKWKTYQLMTYSQKRFRQSCQTSTVALEEIWQDVTLYGLAVKALTRVPSPWIEFSDVELQHLVVLEPEVSPENAVFVSALCLKHLASDLVDRLWNDRFLPRSIEKSVSSIPLGHGGVLPLTVTELLAIVVNEFMMYTSDSAWDFAFGIYLHSDDLLYGVISGRCFDWEKMQNLPLPTRSECFARALLDWTDCPAWTGDQNAFMISEGSQIWCGYLKNPLQTAVEYANVGAVRLLRSMDFDPWMTGDPNGVSFEGAISLWHDLTPLQICRQMVLRVDADTQRALRVIEYMLLHWHDKETPDDLDRELVVPQDWVDFLTSEQASA